MTPTNLQPLSAAQPAPDESRADFNLLSASGKMLMARNGKTGEPRGVNSLKRLPVAAAILTLCATPAVAQEKPAPNETDANDAQELAKKLSNPVASLISVPFQENLDFGSGVTGSGTKST